MQKIIEKLSDGSISHLDLIEEIRTYSECVRINTYPDPDFIQHDKFSDKEYFIEDEIDLSESYAVIFSMTLKDYGFNVDGDLHTDLGDERGLNYEIHRVNERQRKVELRGVLKGGYSEIDAEANANIDISAISKEDYVNLNLYKQLAIDAYLLELESNIKMAFFTYFSAIESIVRLKLDTIQLSIHSELHDALEHLSLDDKIRIVAKESLKTNELINVPLWGEYQGLLREVKKIRNQIAHGKLEREISRLDLHKCIACYIVTFGFSLKRLTTFKDILNLFG